MRLAQKSYFSIFRIFQKTQGVPPFTISKNFSFLALDMAPTLDVPVLLLLVPHVVVIKLVLP